MLFYFQLTTGFTNMGQVKNCMTDIVCVSVCVIVCLCEKEKGRKEDLRMFL